MRASTPSRITIPPDQVERSLVRLALAVIELLHQLLLRQALRRVEAGSLTEEEVERLGTALMRIDETLGALCARFDLARTELNLDLGPLGRLV